MRLWEDEAPGKLKATTRRTYETVGFVIKGRAELEIEAQTQVAELREELAATIAEISGLKEEINAQAETQLVELALEIAKKVVGREVMFDREIAFLDMLL